MSFYCHELRPAMTFVIVGTGVKFDTTLEIFNSDSLFNLPGGRFAGATCVSHK